ncbi:MAG: hypothetical protein LUH10_06020 [Tannerellaceae bacterium]|nr:hypothetical protein [Tannerellaceae bacterium]
MADVELFLLAFCWRRFKSVPKLTDEVRINKKKIYNNHPYEPNQPNVQTFHTICRIQKSV